MIFERSITSLLASPFFTMPIVFAKLSASSSKRSLFFSPVRSEVKSNAVVFGLTLISETDKKTFPRLFIACIKLL